MVPEPSVLVALVQLVDRLPLPPAAPRGRGPPPISSARLFLKAVVIMSGRRLTNGHTLLAVLDQPTPALRQLRALLTEQGRYPTRRTWERRLRRLPATLPAPLGCLGRHLVAVLLPWPHGGCAGAIDSTLLAACGGVWHRQQREAGQAPPRSIDTAAPGTQSGWHGWVDGWKLHLVVTVAAVWIPLAAAVTPANAADTAVAPRRRPELPPLLRFLLGDTSDDDPALRAAGDRADRVRITSKRGPEPQADDGTEGRRLFQQRRSHAIENVHEHDKGLFDGHGSVPTRGLLATRRSLLAAVFVSQVLLLYRFETGGDRRVRLQARFKAA